MCGILRYRKRSSPVPSLEATANLLMRLDISPSDVSFVALQGCDIKRLCELLVAQADLPINGQENPFERIAINTHWGLVVLTFHSSFGSARVPFPIALLDPDFLKPLVVKDTGEWVDRLDKVVEECYKVALDQLQGRPIIAVA